MLSLSKKFYHLQKSTGKVNASQNLYIRPIILNKRKAGTMGTGLFVEKINGK